MKFATHLTNEWMVNFLEYFNLVPNEILYLIFHKQTFIEATKSKIVIGLIFNQINVPKLSSCELFYKLQVLYFGKR